MWTPRPSARPLQLGALALAVALAALASATAAVPETGEGAALLDGAGEFEPFAEGKRGAGTPKVGAATGLGADGKQEKLARHRGAQGVPTGVEDLLSTEEGATTTPAGGAATTTEIHAGSGKFLCYRHGIGKVAEVDQVVGIHYARCDQHATCDSTTPSCTCKTGYAGDGETCSTTFWSYTRLPEATLRLYGNAETF